MAAKPSDENLALAVIKFLLFLVVLYLAAGFTYQFVMAVHGAGDVDVLLLPGTVFFTFCYYLFVKDLNDGYKKIQTFFFRNPLLSYPLPILLIFASVIYFILIKFFSVHVNRALFVFTGGFIVAAHLVFISHETKGETFGRFAGYLLNFILYYLMSLVLLAAYFNIVFNFNVLGVFVDGLDRSLPAVRAFSLKG